MALTSTLGTLAATLENVEPGLGAPPASLARRVALVVTLGGVTLSNVLSARVSLGFDLAISEASVVVASEPGGSYNDEVVVTMGAGRNDVVRFKGLLKQYDRTLFPRSITLVARGRLSRAAEYRPFGQDDTRTRQIAGLPGLNLSELVGSTTLATDQMSVYAALERVPNLTVDAANIGGTGTNLGTLPPDATVWGLEETALSFVQKIDSASQGYRTFESIGGVIWRVQIAGWPGANDPEFTFAEGLDIFEGHSTRTVLELKNCARVDGYDFGIGANIIVFIAPGSNPVQGASSANPQEVRFSTSLAGHINAGAGAGFACEDIANYLLSEWNRELVRLVLTTPRDDIVGPGQTHLVTTGSGAPDRLGTAEKLWVQRVDISVGESGDFAQTITYIGGGVADGFAAPINWATA